MRITQYVHCWVQSGGVGNRVGRGGVGNGVGRGGVGNGVGSGGEGNYTHTLKRVTKVKYSTTNVRTYMTQSTKPTRYKPLNPSLWTILLTASEIPL